ncbi:MAG: sigma 54-interacting transcriptional regulator [Eubacteriales bacterium]|nr:sigma 54-interacting transcriptional regulator [Eubacteriales bacterium]
MELANCELILEHLPGAMVIDLQGTIVYINKQCADYIGTARSHALGRDVREIFPDTKMIDSLKLDKPEIVFYNSFGIGISVEVPIFSEGVKVGLLEYDLVQGSEVLYELADNYTHYLDQELKYLKHQINELRSTKYSINNIIGGSEEIMRMKETIISAAKTNSTVLIYGETGTGKELVAHSIHSLSTRGKHNFIKLNAASIPENLVELELFGYEGGTFTGADAKGKKGKFELADKGTLFIDEINQMPLPVQPKLLRALQENEIERIGGTRSIPVDVRIIVTTNQDLRTMVQDNKFRNDLFYRLHVIVIKVPPLRKRLEDIPLLTDYFVRYYNKAMGRNISHIDEQIYHMFRNFDWPGNVRQLQNVIERGVSFAKGEHLGLGDLDLDDGARSAIPARGPDVPDLIKTVKNDAERKLIAATLARFQGNKTKTAESLGISRSLLYQKMYRLGIK